MKAGRTTVMHWPPQGSGREFAAIDPADLSGIQSRALERFHAHTKEMEEKYGKPDESAASGLADR